MWPYAFLPVIVAVLGATWTALRRPPDAWTRAVQHFAAGVVFYAAAGVLLPQAKRDGSGWSAVLGGGVGIGTMLLLRAVTEKAQGGPLGLVCASGVDALIDRIVLALGFESGRRQGLLLAIALAVEFLFLGLSIAGGFPRDKVRPIRVIASAGVVSLAVPLGMLVGLPLGHLSRAWQGAALAFGVIALLYLAAEDLLVEAHEKPETPWRTGALLSGFLLMMVVSQFL